MDSGSGVLSRNMGSMSSDASTGRPSALTQASQNRRTYTSAAPLNGNDSRSSTQWGNNIWNTTSTTTPSTIGYGFGAPRRESSRQRENNYELTEGKTGSGSLVADSETDWRSGRPTWADAGTSSIPRSSGVSPARKLSLAQAQPLQQFADSSSTFFPISRATAVSKPANSHLDPKSTNFTCARPLDALNASFTNFSFGNGNGQSDSSQRPDTGVTSWPDASSVQSPNDDGRSVACSEYFAPSSGAASRNGSLPPSRHSAEPAQYGQAGDVFARYAQAAPRQPSFSQAPGRAFQERSGSVQSESFQTLSRLAHDQEQDARLAHRASVSTNGFAQHLSPTRQESHVSRDGYLDVHHDASYRNGTYTPDGYLSGQVNDPNGYTRSSSLQFDSRNGPNGASARNSPFYSHAHTPPVIDRLNPYSSEQTLAHPNNAALVQNKLVNYQFQQDRRGFAPQQFQQQQYQQMLSATQLRHPYPYQFLPAGMSISAVPQHMSVAINTMPSPLISVAQPLRGPRDQQSNDGSGVGGLKLAEFRRDIKMGKKWELHMLYDDVVEFAGDQHGSRFIQNKLETANSEVKDKIFKELAPNTLQLMQDVFGNYVIQKFFEHGDQTQKRIMAGKMKGHFLSLACQMYACRVVQKALEHVLVDQQATMVKELEKDVMRAVRDQNGNHVVQKVIERVPMEYIENVVEAFRSHIGPLSVNAYGCRVVQRLLEKVTEPQRRFILTELHVEGDKLITDQYGNYVTQHIIEHGLPEDRAKVVSLVRAKILTFSKHKYASNVVERCLTYGNDGQRRELVEAIIAKDNLGENQLSHLLKDGYGNYVIQKLLETLNRADYDTFVQALKPELEKVKQGTVTGKQIMSVEKKMYRYSDRMDSPSMPRDAIDAPPTPALSSSAPSPQSSSVPSTNTSTVGDPISDTPTTKANLVTNGTIAIEEATS